ncbi:MAG TPA: hypothetical protein PK392_02710, partial [Opitutaceae bacterium]|nr:hypothetical protein [Opitutaceae bacterium]
FVSHAGSSFVRIREDSWTVCDMVDRHERGADWRGAPRLPLTLLRRPESNLGHGSERLNRR